MCDVRISRCNFKEMFYDVLNVVNGVKMHLVVTYYMKRVYEHYVCNIRDKTSGHVGTRL